MTRSQKNSITCFIGVFGFLTIVTFLHIAQIPAGYSPIYQLMSELALGKDGKMMLFAFLGLALATLAAINIISSYQAPLAIKIILALTATAFAGAGYFTLETAMEIHISLVAIAFILLLLCMYLIPRMMTQFQTIKPKMICWGLATMTALAVALGQNILPIGIAQRIATTFILCWFVWLTIFDLQLQKAD
jgi:Protein of unknown function (DUF998)